MNENRIGTLAGVVFGVAAMPLFATSVNNFIDSTASDSDFAAHIADNYVSISILAGLSLLLVGVLVVHIIWLGRYLSEYFNFGAQVAQGCALVTAGAMAISHGFTIVTAYGADEKYPDFAVRTTAMIAENLGISLVIGLAPLAALIAKLGWRKILPMWMGIVATLVVFVSVAATVAGAPGMALVVMIAWILVNSLGMASRLMKSTKNA